MNKLKTRRLSSLLATFACMFAICVAGFAADAAAVPVAVADTASETILVEPVAGAAPAVQQHFFVGLQPHHKLYVQGYLIDTLHFAYNSYGFIAWSMQSARRNLKENLFGEQLKQLDHFITQTIGMAELTIRLTPDSDGLPEIKQQFEALSRAVKLMLEESQVLSDSKEPGAKVIESGKIHEQVGKAIPALFDKLQNSLQQQASASRQIDLGE
ncbi:MAG: hypothetical protein CVV41_06455 [Candidatus Riflebacteria bacterium HGW-Riflebacteria-1]|jgi:hypothetical protein|nr:MAG: hypothetical protein CVV41_06455 [Candidatus Riflebacteria bacterium HGW-Riflebacteria-1]